MLILESRGKWSKKSSVIPHRRAQIGQPHRLESAPTSGTSLNFGKTDMKMGTMHVLKL